MQAAKTNKTREERNGKTLLRTLIGSYFIAVAVGFIPGTDFVALLAHIAEPQVAAVLSGIIIFSLSYMIMVGYRTRAAALALGLITFCAALIAFVTPVGGGDLAPFWRDLALIAALLLTYPAPARSTRRPMGKVKPRRIAVAPVASAARPETLSAITPQPRVTEGVTDLAEVRAKRQMTRPIDLRAPLASDEIDNIFLDYAESS
ncbi:MAG: DoxX family protein [Pseudomonadota bacterium]